jgi:anion-transporting  ArsA/GET3 family ATPase
MEISEFFTSMSGLFEGFEDRVKTVYELLRSPQTAFVLVASPDEQVLAEAARFCQQVDDLSVRLGAIVFNRTHSESTLEIRPGDEQWLRDVLAHAAGDDQRAGALLDNFFQYEAQARGDALRIEAFLEDLAADVGVARVPNFDEDLHDLTGLRRMLPFLLSE